MDLPMASHLMESNPMVEETANQAAVKRGPLVYCLEKKPAETAIMDLTVPVNARLTTRFDSSVLGGVEVIETEGFVREDPAWNESLYRARKTDSKRRIKLQFIPYFAWANRGAGDMTVWLPLTAK
jgi:DUF1680 family protein